MYNKKKKIKRAGKKKSRLNFRKKNTSKQGNKMPIKGFIILLNIKKFNLPKPSFWLIKRRRAWFPFVHRCTHLVCCSSHCTGLISLHLANLYRHLPFSQFYKDINDCNNKFSGVSLIFRLLEYWSSMKVAMCWMVIGHVLIDFYFIK